MIGSLGGRIGESHKKKANYAEVEFCHKLMSQECLNDTCPLQQLTSCHRLVSQESSSITCTLQQLTSCHRLVSQESSSITCSLQRLTSCHRFVSQESSSTTFPLQELVYNDIKNSLKNKQTTLYRNHCLTLCGNYLLLISIIKYS